VSPWLDAYAMKHAPPQYDCPFCAAAAAIRASGALTGPYVFDDERVFALVPLHYYGTAKGNCLVIPKKHQENLFEIDEDLGTDLLRVTKRLALAMKVAFACDGVSTRQHNEPAGDQDVWHFHLHVIPRYTGDSLYSAPKLRYLEEERLLLAQRLRAVLGPDKPAPNPA
jgi:histidine triad (HIT) family protein